MSAPHASPPTALAAIPEGHPHAEALRNTAIEIAWTGRIATHALNPEIGVEYAAKQASLRASFDLLLAHGGATEGGETEERYDPENPTDDAEFVAALKAMADDQFRAGQAASDPLISGPRYEELVQLAGLAFANVEGFYNTKRAEISDIASAIADARAALAKLQADVEYAAGECLVSIPEPGSDLSRVLLAAMLNKRKWQGMEDELRDARAALAESEQRREAAADYLTQLVDDDECDIDHHGNCQTHGLANPCLMPDARAWLVGHATATGDAE